MSNGTKPSDKFRHKGNSMIFRPIALRLMNRRTIGPLTQRPKRRIFDVTIEYSSQTSLIASMDRSQTRNTSPTEAKSAKVHLLNGGDRWRHLIEFCTTSTFLGYIYIEFPKLEKIFKNVAVIQNVSVRSFKTAGTNIKILTISRAITFIYMLLFCCLF